MLNNKSKAPIVEAHIIKPDGTNVFISKGPHDKKESIKLSKELKPGEVLVFKF